MKPPINLTEGAVAMLSRGGAELMPVVQIADIRLVHNTDAAAEERYRILLSDGSFTQQGMLATQQNDLVRSGTIQKGSVVQLTMFVSHVIRNRMIVIIINLDVLVQKCDLIGDPKPYPNPIDLTKGAIAMLLSGDADADLEPVLQIADMRLVNSQNQNNPERYRILLSDGLFTQQGMLATQQNDLVRLGKMQKGSIIKMMQFVCNYIENRMIIIIINLDVITFQCDLIGEPKPYPAKSKWNVPSVTGSTTQPGQPMNQPATGKSPFSSRDGADMSNLDLGRNEAPPGIMPIAALNPYQGRWTIKARVTAKGELRHYTNPRGDGKIFSFDLIDAEGGEITVTCFHAVADQFYQQIEPGRVYMISRGTLIPAQMTPSQLRNDHVIMLDSTSTVQPCFDDDKSIQQQQFNDLHIKFQM